MAQKLEQPQEVTTSEKQQILHDLLVSDAFEHFLATKFPNNKVSDTRCCIC